MIGKYEREALENERRRLHDDRARRLHGLSQMEAKRLDEIERLLGDPALPAKTALSGGVA